MTRPSIGPSLILADRLIELWITTAEMVRRSADSENPAFGIEWAWCPIGRRMQTVHDP